jgi:hypothetical protein
MGWRDLVMSFRIYTLKDDWIKENEVVGAQLFCIGDRKYATFCLESLKPLI